MNLVEASKFAELVTLCFCGLRLERVHGIFSMNSGEMRIRSEFSSRASELKEEMEKIVNNSY